MRTVRTWQRLQARRLGLRGATTAAVCFTQLFGSRLDRSPHFHALAPDAVFLENQQGDIELRRLPRPKLEEIERLVERIARRTLAMLKKELGEDLRLDALDRLRASNLQPAAPASRRWPSHRRIAWASCPLGAKASRCRPADICTRTSAAVPFGGTPATPVLPRQPGKRSLKRLRSVRPTGAGPVESPYRPSAPDTQEAGGRDALTRGARASRIA
jgi:hypothetical protein